MKPRILIFDLDDTLYPASSGVWEAIGKRIDLFIHQKLALPYEDVEPFRKTLFRTYGTTLRGLYLQYHIDSAEYLAFVHDIPLEHYLQPNPELRTLLKVLPYSKVIFTNSDKNHANRVLQRLDLEGCFTQIIDIWDMLPSCKPFPEAFQTLLQKLHNPDPSACLFIDDLPANLHTARRLGFWTVHVSENGHPHQGHFHIRRIEDLPYVLAQGSLFEDEWE
ncbi:pyrimidine 5'-nucleotidase [Thermanaerothrix sp. 4228-RoL]|uniref:Pyrimidine 5'-nucleotidase n=1 Tax=Thermanaerothrix solaris TaxID=3058434 RepID=A0ABU3NK82_9CHLR|nr:pyrimidine 5'-nucleotidase [Thermanaerothrix sp. 4228-RoL]MDT8896740.1 pyrimidine 5'-nucleotidase [Thermanaerothrix sp. 4228-RoL]